MQATHWKEDLGRWQRQILVEWAWLNEVGGHHCRKCWQWLLLDASETPNPQLQWWSLTSISKMEAKRTYSIAQMQFLLGTPEISKTGYEVSRKARYSRWEYLPEKALKLILHTSFPVVNPAAAAKSLQSCPILCDPIDGNTPGSSVPGILQARTLEWVAISFWMHACIHAKLLQLCPTLCDPIDGSPPGSSVHRIL